MSKYRNSLLEKDAIRAAKSLRGHLKLNEDCELAIILGTGWEKTLPISIKKSVSFYKIPGFLDLPDFPGHARRFGIGYYKDSTKPIIVLSGRIHANEIPNSEAIIKSVRLQVEVLYHLGVRTLISTSAVGGLGHTFSPGNIMVVKNFFGLYAPSIVFGGEFVKPHLALDEKLINIALNAGKNSQASVETGIHAMVRGPFLESAIDANALSANADVVGMSIHTEAQIVSLYRDFRMLGLCFVTNMAGDNSSNADHIKVAKKHRRKIKGFLVELFDNI